MDMRKCTKCGETKLIEDFGSDKSRKDGLARWCKKCLNESTNLWHKANRDKSREISRRWAKAHPEKVRASNQKREKANPEKVREAYRKWVKDNPEKAKKRAISSSERAKRWMKANPEKTKIAYRKASAKKVSTPKGHLNHNVSRAIRSSLHGNKQGRHWESLVQYSLVELMAHIEKQFHPGMRWENYGNWHIDHKIPKSVFNFEKPEDDDFQKCWALKNLQPLWAVDNLIKHAKINQHFQPSLIF